MTQGVAYLLTDAQMAARLVVAIFSLRGWYSGPIALFTTRPESAAFGKLIKSDKRLGTQHYVMDEIGLESQSKSAYRTKVQLASVSPFQVTLYIDADTLVVGSVDELIRASKDYPLVVTPFGNQSTLDRYASKVWPSWRREIAASPYGQKWLHMVDEVANHSHPLINTGVFSSHKDPKFLSEWRELSEVGANAISPDESSLQMLLSQYQHFLIDNAYNCIPEIRSMAGYQCQTDPSQAKILHFACSSHLDYPYGHEFWLPVFQECCRLKIAQIDRWHNVDPEAGARIGRRRRG